MTTPAKTPRVAAAKPAARPTTRTAAKPAAKAAAKPAVKATAKPVVAASAAKTTATTAETTFTKRYKMLTGIDDAAFCDKVVLHLENGYELYGSPVATFNGKTVIVGQAVVLKKLPAKKKPGKKK